MFEKQGWEARVEEAAQKLNLQWYKNEDRYSDGDIEDDIIKYIAQYEPEDYDKAVCEHLDWAVYYHLTNVRRNLLNWYPFQKEASVLEIGAGCGALTGLLCDKCKKVTAVELSKRRATAAQLRCREKDNLEVIVGNLNDIEFGEKFDYITLIGVLEYQGTYTDSASPYKDFLVKIKSLLKDDGKLLVAIENKYGVKYWCGAGEDHTGVPFDGLNQYKLGGQKTRTFAREELTELLKESGYTNCFFYYPMPDYKLPTVVYSDQYKPRNENLENAAPYYIPSDETLLIREKGLYRDIVKNNVFPFFANSFLVECSSSLLDQGEEEKVIFAVLNSRRQKEYRLGTLIKNSGKVVKFPLENTANNHFLLSQILDNMEEIRSRGLKTLPYRVNQQNELEMDFVKLPLLENYFRDALSKGDEEEIWDLWDGILEKIDVSSEEAEQDQCIIYELKLDQYQGNQKYGKILRKGYVDMVPKNCFVDGDELLWFDQEWTLDYIPVKFVLYRAMVEVYTAMPEMENLIPATEFIKHYKMEECLDAFIELNQLFLDMVMNPYYVEILMERNNKHVFRKNVLKLL